MPDAERYGYRRLEVYRLAHELAVAIHKMTMTLPRFELYEEGSQIRRSSKSVSAQIVEGYAIRKYKDEFLHFLYRALASSDETLEHLDMLRDTDSLTDTKVYSQLKGSSEKVSSKLARFISGVEQYHTTPVSIPSRRGIENRKSRIENR